MTGEPQRLQYLEAMGLTAWVARYRLPNARASEACDWPEPEVAQEAPGERLQALLDAPVEAPPVSRAPVAEPEARQRPPGGARKARALLGDLVPEEAEPTTTPSPSLADAASLPRRDAPVEALRFTLQVACLDGRWLVILPTETPPGPVAQRLLGNLLRAAGVVPTQAPAFEAFRWPQVEGLPVQAPLEEAREGLQAFLAGRRRRGWAPERLLVFGEDVTLGAVLAIEAERCPALGLPTWQGPDLTALAGDGAAKRALWPRLVGWREAWSGEAGDG